LEKIKREQEEIQQNDATHNIVIQYSLFQFHCMFLRNFLGVGFKEKALFRHPFQILPQSDHTHFVVLGKSYPLYSI